MPILNPEENIASIISLIENAEKFVVIASPYSDLTGWDKLKKAMNEASKRNVEIAYYVREGQGCKGIEDIHVKIYEVPMLHAKMFFNERKAIISSFHLLNNRDINWAFVLNEQEEYKGLVSFFENYIKPLAKPFRSNFDGPKPSKIKSESLSTGRLEGSRDGSVIRSAVLPNEIEGVQIEYISVKGPIQVNEKRQPIYYQVLLSLKGEARLTVNGKTHRIKSNFIAKIPYNEQYSIRVDEGGEFHFLCFKQQLNDDDLNLILQRSAEHSVLYLKALSDCPVYTEEIKSSKTLNRMILPEGFVPRFCMGSVETTGPDLVAEHEHPMLDQLFLGLANCKCTCLADGDQTILSENMMLHIPLGSKHSVSVEENDTLAYIWFDFFFTLQGQDYMSEQHKMEDN